MATNFPTSLDTLTNPTSTDNTATVSHADQHANANDAIEALQAKVGADSSAVTTSVDYKVSNTASVDPGHKHTVSSINATGTADATTYLRGDGNWATPGGGGQVAIGNGTQTANSTTTTNVTGLGFQPTTVEVHYSQGIQAATVVSGSGFSDGTNNYSVGKSSTTTPLFIPKSDGSNVIDTLVASTGFQATITMTADGFDIAWTKGAGTQSFDLNYTYKATA